MTAYNSNAHINAVHKTSSTVSAKLIKSVAVQCTLILSLIWWIVEHLLNVGNGRLLGIIAC